MRQVGGPPDHGATIMIWFTLTVFGKVVLTVGPLQPTVCQTMLDTFEPPVLTDAIIADGKIVTAGDYKPWCIVSPVMPPMGVFDRGSPT